MLGNFNTDLPLWQSSLKAHRASRTTLEVGKFGSVFTRGGKAERIAQFDDEATAVKTLLEAGYKQDGRIFK